MTNDNKIKAIIFDLDGTLYKSTEIRTKFAEAAYYTLSKFKKIGIDDAKRLLERKREELKREYGEPVPYTLTLKSFGMSVEQWHKENVSYFDPRDYLTEDNRLRKSLIELKEHYHLAILTNNNSIQTERILEALAIKDLFDRIFTYNTFKLLKPSLEFLKRAVDVLQVAPEECCFVGDRYNVDLSPAKRLGMHIYEVKGPEDVYCLFDKLVECMCIKRSAKHEKII